MSRRYAVIGLGHRSQLYVDALLGDWRDAGRLVAFCDPNRTRMAFHNDRVEAAGLERVPCYHPDELATVLASADAVIVTTVDAIHARYVRAALDAGLDVVVEKPMTVDEDSCAAIAEAAERSSGQLIVTFNYRYSPRNTAVREILAAGRIGAVTTVHFEWLLDTVHGADYFRRWHRQRKNSGGLLVHKATHHFDLVNWWLDSHPELVFAQTGLNFYGDTGAGAELGRLPRRPERSHGAATLGSDPFLLDIAADPRLKRLYLDAEHEDGYLRDRDVFTEGIDIDDTMSVLVRYAKAGYAGGFQATSGSASRWSGSDGSSEGQLIKGVGRASTAPSSGTTGCSSCSRATSPTASSTSWARAPTTPGTTRGTRNSTGASTRGPR